MVRKIQDNPHLGHDKISFFYITLPCKSVSCTNLSLVPQEEEEVDEEGDVPTKDEL